MSSTVYHIDCPKCGGKNAAKDVDKHEGIKYWCPDCDWDGTKPTAVETPKGTMFYSTPWDLLDEVVDVNKSEIEYLDPISLELQVKLHNADHPHQFTKIKYVTKDELKEFADRIGPEAFQKAWDAAKPKSSAFDPVDSTYMDYLTTMNKDCNSANAGKEISEMSKKKYSLVDIHRFIARKKCPECDYPLKHTGNSPNGGWVYYYSCVGCSRKFEFQDSDMGQSLPSLECISDAETSLKGVEQTAGVEDPEVLAAEKRKGEFYDAQGEIYKQAIKDVLWRGAHGLTSPTITKDGYDTRSSDLEYMIPVRLPDGSLFMQVKVSKEVHDKYIEECEKRGL